MGSRAARGSVTTPMAAGSRRNDTANRPPAPIRKGRQMAARRPPDDDYRRLMQVAARIGRLTGVTTSVFALGAAAVALVAIVVALILSL